ncbi:hypothetical protein [Leifsonia sp. Leaf264]|uniref:hypothetical protein n=1 Tax=Leifsonia sp. Leaf264 TaxID=1736314 RepID=UPI0006FFD974|nr:hypothetical protein [Leifsonia sp. Leaf264]KQO98173.1 hypothetical protein ASF30_08925 [Leifsonia sp. Leaf264]
MADNDNQKRLGNAAPHKPGMNAGSFAPEEHPPFAGELTAVDIAAAEEAYESAVRDRENAKLTVHLSAAAALAQNIISEDADAGTLHLHVNDAGDRLLAESVYTWDGYLAGEAHDFDITTDDTFHLPIDNLGFSHLNTPDDSDSPMDGQFEWYAQKEDGRREIDLLTAAALEVPELPAALEAYRLAVSTHADTGAKLVAGTVLEFAPTASKIILAPRSGKPGGEGPWVIEDIVNDSDESVCDEQLFFNGALSSVPRAGARSWLSREPDGTVVIDIRDAAGISS